jgi:Tol biopolymer transport system component
MFAMTPRFAPAAAAETRAAAIPAQPRVFEVTSHAELVLPGIASTAFSEVRLAVSPDGKTMLWGSKDRPGGPGGWDIWVTRQGARGWSAPEPVAFDSPDKEFDPAYSPDGQYVYFFSNRPGTLGGDDVFRVPATGSGFGVVEHLGAEVNSAGDEWAPAISPDGKTLLFASDGRGGAGRRDLFVARLEGRECAPAQPLPGAVNTAADEFDATFLPDGRGLVFTRSADIKSDPVELFFAALGPEGYDAGTILPTTVNVSGGYTYGPAIDWADGATLYFTSQRPEAKVGKNDLYRVRFAVKP